MSNYLTDKIAVEYKPTLALVIYSVNKGNDYYIESHAIDDKGAILEGKPLKQDTLNGIVDVFYEQQKERATVTGIYPANLLQFAELPGGHTRLLWYTPAHIQMLNFSEQLNIKSGPAQVPAMLWLAKRGELWVFALPNDERPDMNTQIYRAPFHNTSEDGLVCLGSASARKPVERTFANIMKYWEDMFWLSEFTHLNGANSPTKTNLNILWSRLLQDNNLKWADLDELKQIKGLQLKKFFQ